MTRTIKLRVPHEIQGLFPECQPERGMIYEGTYHEAKWQRGFAVIEVKGKKIVVRAGEFEEVEGDLDMKRPTEETVETMENMQTPNTESTKKRGRKKSENEEKCRETAGEPARVPASDEDVFERLCEAQRRIYQLERALLAVTMERYR